MAQLASFKDYTTICSSAPSEILALAALRAREQVLRRNLEIIGTNLNVLDNFFTQHAQTFRWARPKAGTIAFPEYLGAQGVEAFCAGLVEKKGVMLVPAGVFDCIPVRTSGWASDAGTCRKPWLCWKNISASFNIP